MIQVYDRNKGKLVEEKVAGGSFLSFLYNNNLGKLLLHSLIKRHIFQKIIGTLADTSFSKRFIPSFIKEHGINMEESLKDIDNFTSFNDFFTRKLKSGSRQYLKYNDDDDDNDNNLFENISDINSIMISPGDGRLSIKKVQFDDSFIIKGIEYKYSDLVPYDNLDLMLTLRLNPTDYHRFHYPLSGYKTKNKKVPGIYYSVNPLSLKKHPEVFWVNKKESFLISNEILGDVFMVAVGATSVGSIIMNDEEEKFVLPGEEAGYFKFGGSTLLLFMDSKKVTIDEDILTYGKDYELIVKMGEVLGRSKMINQ